ncbi:hypothetical protein [Aquabacterium parvum]|uniref:hypothetical protein n=1 Tax=Aquabacterium parvum TaxID=70584 RepID=UPI001F15F5BA|nr:hypothetical protein [Aquabacterium parvum]
MPNPAASTCPPVTVTARWWLLARWVLVALLVVDQVSAPFHEHQHGGGVDATWSAAHSHDDKKATTHAEDVNHDGVGHWALAVRSTSSAGSVAAAGEVTNDLALAFLAGLNNEVVSEAREGADAGLTYARWRPPPISAHRSLPPDGHAPPALA